MEIDNLGEDDILQLIDILENKYQNVNLSDWNDAKDDYSYYKEQDVECDSYAADACNRYWKMLSNIPEYFLDEPGAKEIILKFISDRN